MVWRMTSLSRPRYQRHAAVETATNDVRALPTSPGWSCNASWVVVRLDEGSRITHVVVLNGRRSHRGGRVTPAGIIVVGRSTGFQHQLSLVPGDTGRRFTVDRHELDTMPRHSTAIS